MEINNLDVARNVSTDVVGNNILQYVVIFVLRINEMYNVAQFVSKPFPYTVGARQLARI